MPDLSHTIVYAAVRGAVKNALDGHPQWVVPPDFARSVAKRAAGTLAGMNPSVALAAARRSGKRGVWAAMSPAQRARAPLMLMASSLSALKAILDRLATDAHKAGDHGRFVDLCNASRAVKREIARWKAES